MRKFFIATVVAVVSLIGSAPTAKAAFQITLYVDGVNQNVGTVGNAQHFSVPINVNTGTVDGVSFFNINSINANTNWSGTQVGGARLGSSFNADFSTDFGPNGGTHTLTIVLSENGWLAPAGNPLGLSLSAGGSIGNTPGGPSNQTLTVDSTAQGFLDTGNVLATSQTPVGSTTPLASASASVNGTNTDNLVYTPDPATSLVPGAVPFTLTTVYTFTVTTDGNNTGDFNVSGSLTAAAPAPAGLVLALTGLPTLGLGAWLRRRRQAV
jgi:hypothetical protein